MASSGPPGSYSLYQKLPQRCIRVLRLIGTSLTENVDGAPQDLVIDCEMQTIQLASARGKDKAVPYSALSYVWGSPRFNRWLRCNGILRPITPNLYQVLWHLTFSKDAPKLLWVDAVCINQADPEEKGHQVAMMAEIYRQAELVTVWLGANPPSSFALEAFWDRMTSMSLERFQDIDSFGENDRMMLHSAVQFLARAEWFERLWTYQEIALAHRARAWCGFLNVDWRRLSALTRLFGDQSAQDASRIEKSPSDSDSVPDDHEDSGRKGPFEGLIARAELGKVLRAFASITEYQSSPAMSLYSLIQITSLRQATDARDKIYGLLGLWQHGPRLVPDYTSSYSQVTAKAVVEIFNEEYWIWLNLRNIPIIHVKEYLPTNLCEPITDQVVLDVPVNTAPVSWLPNFSDSNADVPEYVKSDYLSRKDYFMDEWSYQGPHVPETHFDGLDPKYRSHIALDGITLQAKGVILGTWSRYYALGASRWEFNGAPGVFEGFPSCVVDSRNLGVDVNVPNGTSSFVNAAHVYELMLKHIDTQCTCADRTVESGTAKIGRKIKSKLGLRSRKTHELAENVSSNTNAQPGSHSDAQARNQKPNFAWLCLVFGKGVPLVLQPQYDESDGTVSFVMLNRLHMKHHWSISICRSGEAEEFEDEHENESLGQDNWNYWAWRRTGTRNDQWYREMEVTEDGYDRVLSLALRQERYPGQLRRESNYETGHDREFTKVPECHLNWIPTRLDLLGEISDEIVEHFERGFDRNEHGLESAKKEYAKKFSYFGGKAEIVT